MGFPQLPDRGDPQVLSSLSTGPLDNPPEMSNIGSLTPATGRRPWTCLVSRVKWGWFFVGIRRSRASLLRSLTLKLLVAGVLAMAFTAASMSATAKPAAAGAFPALLDRNAGSVMSPLSIHNLYWDTDWNTHNPGESMQQIDDATMAMVSSGYFAKLGQYGVASATFDGSHQADPSCGGAGSSVDYFNISGFVLCEKHFFNLAPGLVYMVYAPVTAGFSMLGATSCNPATGVAGFGGFHFQTLFSVIPPDVPQVFGIDFAQCTTGLDGATQTGAHEIVEAATDPLPPFDWIDNSVVTSISIAGVGALFTAGEAADLCESGVGSPAPAPNPPTSADPRVTGTLGNYAVAYYWSNADGACVPLPDTIMLDQTGLPTAGHATFDGSTVTLPFTTTVADNTTHSFSFPSPVPDPGNPAGIRYVTSQPSFSGVVTSSISVIATYTQQFFLTVTTNPAFLRPLDGEPHSERLVRRRQHGPPRDRRDHRRRANRALAVRLLDGRHPWSGDQRHGADDSSEDGRRRLPAAAPRQLCRDRNPSRRAVVDHRQRHCPCRTLLGLVRRRNDHLVRLPGGGCRSVSGHALREHRLIAVVTDRGVRSRRRGRERCEERGGGRRRKALEEELDAARSADDRVSAE